MPPIVVLLAALALWQAVHMTSGSADVPAPALTVLRLWQMLGASRFWSDVGASCLAFIAALLISLAAGIGAGIVLGLHQPSEAAVAPLLSNFYAIPKVTLYPIVLGIFGLGMAPKVAFGVMHALVPITLLTARAIAQLRPVYLRAAKVMRLNLATTVRTIVLPAILPELLGAIRIGASLSLLGVLIGEMFAAKQGLGFAAMRAMGLGDTTAIAAIGLFLVLFAVAINTALLTIERKTRRGITAP